VTRRDILKGLGALLGASMVPLPAVKESTYAENISNALLAGSGKTSAVLTVEKIRELAEWAMQHQYGTFLHHGHECYDLSKYVRIHNRA